MPPIPAPRQLSAPAPTCVCGGWPMQVISSSATSELPGTPARWPCTLQRGISELLWEQSLSPCHPVSPSLGTFPDENHPASTIVQHKAVIRARAEQAVAERAAGGHLGQVHARRVVSDTCPWRGRHCGVTWGSSSPMFSPTHPATLAFPILACSRAPVVSPGAIAVSIPWPCLAPCGFPKGHQRAPGPCPTSMWSWGPPWCPLAVPSLMYLQCLPW